MWVDSLARVVSGVVFTGVRGLRTVPVGQHVMPTIHQGDGDQGGGDRTGSDRTGSDRTASDKTASDKTAGQAGGEAAGDRSRGQLIPAGVGRSDPWLPVVVAVPDSPPELDIDGDRMLGYVPGHWVILVAAIAAAALGVACAGVWPLPGRPPITAAAPPGSGATPRPDAARSTAAQPPARPNRSLEGACRTPLPAPRLVVNLPPVVMAANEGAVLGIGIDGAPEGAHIAVCGLPPNAAISTGQWVNETTWTLAPSDLDEAILVPPPGFAGEMPLDLVLVRADRTVADRRTLKLAWQPAPPPGAAAAMRPDPEIERQIEEARQVQAAGDLMKARAILRRYAPASARAALMLADTYDPISLSRPRVLPPDADPAAARLWYRKAADLGAPDAAARMERLEQWLR